MRDVEVLAVGAGALLEDLGRPGYAALGVGASGAADVGAHRRANRVVGNADDTATLEVLMGGLTIRAVRPVIVALTGALAVPRINGRVGAYGVPLALRAGDVLELGLPESGLRSYLAVRGGWDAPRVLGSRSTDTLSRVGPSPVAPGDFLGVGTPGAGPAAMVAAGGGPPHAGTLVLEVTPGPRVDWLAEPGSLAGPWVVTNRADRVGVRLDGARLRRSRARIDSELPSEGVVRGAVQVPGSGQPVVFGADHPVTGGYPVVAVLTREASDGLAQARPGQVVRFKPRTSRDARPG